MKYDIVLCVGVKDLFISQIAIESIVLNLCAERIFIISKKSLYLFFKSIIKRHNNIIFIDEDTLLDQLSKEILKSYILLHNPHLSKKTGWYFQQFLKMGFARSDFSQNLYLIWDADTIPIKKLDFFSDKKIMYCLKDEYHVPYFDTIDKLIGQPKAIAQSFIAEHMMIDVKHMKELLNLIESNDNIAGKYYWQKIISSIDSEVLLGFSEFETYGSFAYNRYPNSITFRALKTFREAGKIYGRYIHINEVKKITCFDTISLEPADKPNLQRRIKQYPLRFLIRLISIFS